MGFRSESWAQRTKGPRRGDKDHCVEAVLARPLLEVSGDSSSKAVFFLSMQIDASIRRMTNTSNTFDGAPWPIRADVAGVTVQLAVL